ncbi:MAG: polysaccharide deacetylase family protein [Kiritimatiellae bacterium]|nr:polysaccharide deacetylase family protein [Kiritimatiellia bacterium]
MDNSREAHRIVLTFDDACRSHLDTVAPLLQRHGFGATFFITRFGDEWRAKNGGTLLGASDVRALSDMGFEIGNHSWSHASKMDSMDAVSAAEEIDSLDRWLADAGVPAPDLYAYPGGPYSAQGEALIRARGYKCARSCIARAWNPATDDPFRIPAIPVTENGDWNLFRAYAEARPDLVPAGTLPAFVFHGVPDRVHPWVNTEVGTFEAFIDFIAGLGVRGIGLGAALRERP